MRNHLLQMKIKGQSYTTTQRKKYMKNTLFMLVISIFIVLLGCEQKTSLTIDMYNTSKDMVGTVKLTEDPDGVKAKVKVEGLSPGFHGIHVHEFANCSGNDFKNAGNHLNPTDKEHGLMNAKGAHLGDLPNIKVGSDGKMAGEVTIVDATLMDGNNSIKGSSMVITKDLDDGMTQPAGESGKRIICGTIKKEAGKKGKESPSDPTEKK